MSDTTVIGELRRIAGENGGVLNPAAIVESARVKSSPLHDKFEWDDTKAAQQFRLEQARRMIRVTVEYIGSEDNGVVSRVFVSLTTDRNAKGGYRTVEAVMGHAKTRAQLFEDALTDMALFQKRYRHLKELEGVFVAMGKVRPRKTKV